MSTFTLSALVTTMIVGSLIPILVGAVTKLQAPAWVKAWLHLLLSAIAGGITSAITLDGTAVLSRATLLNACATWLVGIAAYHGFLRPTNISTAVNVATKDIGIG